MLTISRVIGWLSVESERVPKVAERKLKATKMCSVAGIIPWGAM